MTSALLSFFIVLFAGLLFSELSNRFHLPWVIALIFAGVVIGPNGLGLVVIDSTLDFIAEIGLVFLMFMAGLGAKFSSFKRFKKEIAVTTIFNAGLPFIAGLFVGFIFHFSLLASLLLGIIFISSSIAVIVPSLGRRGYLKTKIGRVIVDSVVIQDVFSLIALSIIFQSTNDLSPLPLYILYPLLVIIFFGLRWIISYVKKVIQFLFSDKGNSPAHEVQVVVTMLLGAVVIFQFLGLHPIVGGFLAGLILSSSVTRKELIEKLKAISFGIFIPIFFIVIGIRTDLSILARVDNAVMLVGVILVAAILSKFVGGWLGAKLSGFNMSESSLFGVASISHLSTTLAVAFSGLQLGIIGPELVAALIILSSVATFLGPFLTGYFKPEEVAAK